MTVKGKSFLLGLMMGLFGHGIYLPGGGSGYVFDPETGLLIVYKDDGSLAYSFSEADFSLTVTEV